jgi:hypothetical protein
MKTVITMVLLLAMLVPVPARAQAAQVTPDVWRTFAQNIDTGSELMVRLQDGTRFRAALVGVRDDGVLLQPKTRQPVPVQVVPYAAITSLERRQSGGMGAAKAAAIGIATGAGAFFAMLFIAIAVAAD